MINRSDRLLTVVSPASVETWYQVFTASPEPVLFVGEEGDYPDRIVTQINSVAAGRPVRIFSGHDSLVRDFAVGETLRAAGVVVHSQSGFAVAAGIDKLLQKRVLAAMGVPIPRWGQAQDEMPEGVRILRKLRESAQSRGLGWAEEPLPAPVDHYWEEFVPGVEYSVVVYREGSSEVVLPIVWKGHDRMDLVPPWRRLRLVPCSLEESTAELLIAMARRVSSLFGAWGFVEVEFIVPSVGAPVMIDINPRICGTMRIAGMAAGARLFDPAALLADGNGVRPAARFAAEVPYNGSPFATADAIGTSRLTCVANHPAEVRRALADHGVEIDLDDESLPEGWRAN